MGPCHRKPVGRVGARRVSQRQSRVLSLLRHNSGSTAAEYAILLALLITGTFVVGQALSYSANKTFEELTFQSSSKAQDANPLSSGEVLPNKVETGSTWGGQQSVLLERIAMLLLLIACFYLVRRQRKVVHASIVAKEEAKVKSNEQLQVYLKRQQIYQVLSSNIDSLFNSQVQVQHLMSKRVTTVKPHIQVARMRQLMIEKQVRHLLVCDETQHLIGIISDRDLHCSDTTTAEEVMSRDLITVPPETLVSTVISLMLKEQISSIPIVLEGRIQGLMTTTDLIMAMQCSLQLWSQMADDLGVAPSHEPQHRAQENEALESEELELMSV